MVRISWFRELCTGIVLCAPAVLAASLQKVTDKLANNPTNVGFYIYVPDQLPAKPPIVVNPHACHGSAQTAFTGSQFAALSSKHGYIVIYPDAPHPADHCWDVSSRQTLTHNGGGDSLGIVAMVNWTLAKYGADAGRVFATGVSSGAMMTSTLLGTYPDVFAAGSAFSGVPFGCFAAPAAAQNTSQAFDYWNDSCAKGKTQHAGADWAALVRDAFPGYDGWRPKVQIFHGTADETLDYTDFKEEVKQWNAVFGFDAAPTTTTPNTPLPGWTKTVYGAAADDWFEAYSAAGVPHNIPIEEAVTLAWFDLACTGSGCFKWGQGGPARNGSAVTASKT
ncbi:Esterase, PHB depolymerase [Niveomyces insectorum RCEF 264]|uniref:Carboxylic ester hydrolase n=1 Tax=Niveomyces insectorum RCEF 264 TaxID=1081102 RepID=A0A167YWW0_9HYPO|nr:Esterase, PHB depolymerase [Niveomyces insectorum RCEF 264]